MTINAENYSSLESEKEFVESFKVTLVPLLIYFILEFHLLSCELYNFTFKKLYRVILY